MSSHFTSEQLWVWVHELEDDENLCAQIEAHVADCRQCQGHVAQMRDLLGDLGRAAQEPAAAASRPLPEAVGPYRLIRKIGHGGMGIVYEARQRETDRSVALKVILGGQHLSDLQVRLFQREVRVLARLNHPAIAAIYEAGRTDDGNYFFVMELVDGVTLLDRVEGGNGNSTPLTLTQRLRLFIQICEGMSYAHQRGVIHRDLKPANILVSGVADPRVKILDFGLARAIDDDANAGATIATESGRLLGTLPYMSPEQAGGTLDQIDLRSDVYALGVIFYQMLTGEMPYDVRGLPLVEAVRIICETRPMHPQRYNRSLPQEVAIIVLKTLEKDPAQRYQSVAAMIDDLQRYMNGYPIQARAPSTVYQLRKMVARHKIPAALIALLLLSILSGGVLAMVQAGRIATEAAKKSRIIAEFESLYEAADPWKAGRRDITILDTLDAKSREFESAPEDDPLVAAAVRNTIGNTYLSFSDLRAAEKHLLFALETRRRLLGDDDLETSESLNDAGELRYMQERFDEAEILWQRALAIRRRIGSKPDISESLNNLGILSRKRGRSAEARQMLEESLRVRRQTYAALMSNSSSSVRERRAACNDVAQTLNNLGGLYRSMDAPDAIDRAERSYREALRLRLGALGPDHPEVAKLQNNIAKVFEKKKDHDAAAAAYRESLRIMRQDSGLGREHQYIARALHSLAALEFRRARYEEAERLANESLQMRRRKLGRRHPETVESEQLLKQIRMSLVEQSPERR